MPDTEEILSAIDKGYAIYVRNLDSGLNILNEALSQSIRSKYYDGIFEANQGLGNIYASKNETGKAKLFYQQALFYSKKTSRPYLNVSRVFSNMGNILSAQGKYEDAAKYFYNAALIIKNDSSSTAVIHTATLYNNLAIIFVRTKQYSQALWYLDEAEKIRVATKTSSGLPYIYNNKGMIYKKLTRLDRAQKYYEQSIALADKYGNEQSKAVAINGLAEILILEEKYEKAIPLLENLMQSSYNVNLYYMKTGPMYLLGNAYMSMKQYAKGEKYLQDALKRATELHLYDHILKTNKSLSELYTRTGDYHKAFVYLKNFLTIYDSSSNSEKLETISELEVKYKTAEKDRKILEDQLLIKRQSEKISTTKRWILLFSGSSLALCIIAFLLYRNTQNRKKLQEATIRDMEQQQEINTLKAIMQGEEKERTRIAQELHDGIGGTLAAVKMNFTAVQNDHAFLEQVKSFQYAMNLLNDMTNELRHTAHNLMPEMLMQYGLPEAMKAYCLSIKKGKELTIEFQTYGSFDNLGNDFTLYIYRIMQELIHNIVKHSKATHAIVQLSHYENLLTIAVEDNGVGFSDINKGNGIGLINLQSRVKKLNGTFTIEASEQKGTAIYIEFDLQQINIETV